MSIDAVIDRIDRTGIDTILHLRPRIDSQGNESIPGQRRMIIPGIDFRPEEGMEIWGGGGEVEIVYREPYTRRVVNLAIYDRVAYVGLKFRGWKRP